MTDHEDSNLEFIIPDAAFKKAWVARRENTVKLKDFEGVYPEEEMRADIKYVNDLERKFKEGASDEQRELKALSLILEAIIDEQIELAEWFGPEAHTTKTSRYDDIKNGVDSVIELKNEENQPERLALAVDVALGSQLNKKFQRIRKEIETGSLTTVKYFESEIVPGDKGELKEIPRVVIAADRSEMQKLSELWLEEDNKALATHPFQFHILAQVKAQLTAFTEYALVSGQPRLAEIYKKDLKIVNNIIINKAAIAPEPEELRESLANGSGLAAVEKNLISFKTINTSQVTQKKESADIQEIKKQQDMDKQNRRHRANLARQQKNRVTR